MFKKLSKVLAVVVCIAAVGCGHSAFAQDDTAVYDEAVASIENYNKVDALRMAIVAVDTQIPEFLPYYDMYFGDIEITGRSTWSGDMRNGFMGGGVPNIYDGLAFNLATINGDTTETFDEFFENGFVLPEKYQNLTIIDLVDMAKTTEKYKTDTEFKEDVDECETMYNRGVASLRKNLPIVDPVLTNLDTKTGAELLALYRNLPEVKAGTYSQLINEYMHAKSTLSITDDAEDANANFVAEAYGNLVAAAKAINPDFTVDLSALMTSAPTAPDTGATDAEQLSATIVKVAVFGIAALAAGVGAVVVAKRYLFSPLKRRQ